MKKYNLLKVLAITVFVAWVLTLIIPGSYVDYSGNVTKDAIAGIGVWSLFSNLSVSISYFNGIAILVIAIACFYAILSKVNVYDTFVKKVATTFKNKEGLLVCITTVLFAVISMLVNDAIILLVFVPFVYQVMKVLEIDKKVILSSTIIAGLLGSMCGIYNSNLFSAFNITVNTLLLVKVILLVFSVIILLFFITPKRKEKRVKKDKELASKTSKKEETKKVSVKKVSVKEERVNKTLYAILTLVLGTFGVNKFYARDFKAGIARLLFCWTLVPTILSIAEFITVLTEKSDKDGNIPAVSQRRTNVLFGTSVVLFTLFVIFTIIPWESLISGFTGFSDFNSWLSNIKIGDYKLFNNVIGAPIVLDATTGASSGAINAFGAWTMSDVAILLFILTGIIALANKIKINDYIATITSGVKKVLPVAITAMLISIVLIMMVTSGVNVTITNWILTLSKGFNIATATLASMIGSILTGDFYYFISSIGTVFTSVATTTDYYGVTAFIMQSIYNLMMVIAPTSVGLVIGLYYLDIPYNKWLKFIWKAFLTLFVLVIITAIVIYVLV